MSQWNSGLVTRCCRLPQGKGRDSSSRPPRYQWVGLSKTRPLDRGRTNEDKGNDGMSNRAELMDKEFARFVKRIVVDDEHGCWLWGGDNPRIVYRNFFLGGRTTKAHVLMYRLLKDDYNPALQVAHSVACQGRRHCVNPAHLRMASKGENLGDRIYPQPKTNAEHQRASRAYRKQLEKDRPADLEIVRKLKKKQKLSLDELFPGAAAKLARLEEEERDREESWARDNHQSYPAEPVEI